MFFGLLCVYSQAWSLGASKKLLKTIMSAISGGTASVLGGGKFANGAMSGAFIYMFNKIGISKEEVEMLRKMAAARASAYEKAFGKQAHSYMFDKTPIFDGIIQVGGYAVEGAFFFRGLAVNITNALSVEISSSFAGAVTGSGIGLIFNKSGTDPNELFDNYVDDIVEEYK
jgi:hypothetical protein